MDQQESILPRRFALAIYATASFAAVGALVIHTTGLWGWQVDVTSFALIAFLLLIPIAERLRKFKFGGYFEAEFEESVNRKFDHLDRKVIDISDNVSEPGEAVAIESIADAHPAPSARTIRRIVWVDDEPEGNRLELAELELHFEVVTATSTREGLNKVAPADETAVITDAVRVEGGEENLEAGVELIEALGSRYPGVPAYVYCGQTTAEQYAEPLELAGARVVTASFVALSRAIRGDARIGFEAEVAQRLAEHGSVASEDPTVDLVLDAAGRRIGVEVMDYRIPEARPIEGAAARLNEALGEGKIDDGYVVTRRHVNTAIEKEMARHGVQLISLDEMPAVLQRLQAKG